MSLKKFPEHDREKVLRKLLGYVERWEWNDVKMSFICSGAPIVFDKELRELKKNLLYYKSFICGKPLLRIQLPLFLQ